MFLWGNILFKSHIPSINLFLAAPYSDSGGFRHSRLRFIFCDNRLVRVIFILFEELFFFSFLLVISWWLLFMKFFFLTFELFLKFHLMKMIKPFASKVVKDKDSDCQEKNIGQQILTHIRLWQIKVKHSCKFVLLYLEYYFS